MLENKVATELSEMRQKNADLQRLGSAPLPTEMAVEALLGDMRNLLFPGFFDHPAEDEARAKASTIRALKEVKKNLLETLSRLVHAEQAEHAATHLLEMLPTIAAKLLDDLDAAYMGDPSIGSRQEIVYGYPGFKAITIHRLAHALMKLGIPLLPRLMAEIAHSRTGIDIHPGAQIGRRFFIDHGTGVVIGETCVIGANVKIYQGVTLGALSFARDAEGKLVRHIKRHPSIEDGVVIYANATILGGNTVIGHDSVIGSSVWLNQSVAPFTIVTLEKPLLRYRGQQGESVGDFQI